MNWRVRAAPWILLAILMAILVWPLLAAIDVLISTGNAADRLADCIAESWIGGSFRFVMNRIHNIRRLNRHHSEAPKP